jgi:hypothetical protein
MTMPLRGGGKFGNVRADLRRSRAHCMRSASFAAGSRLALHNTGDFP